MPRACSVSGCRSNYKGEPEYTSVFSLPKEPLRSQWLRKIPTDFSKLKNPMVCIKHFQASQIIWEEEVMVKGELKRFKREVPKYVEGAIPTIFQNLSKYLSSTTTTTRRLVDAEKENLDLAIKNSIETLKCSQQNNVISGMQDVIGYLQKRTGSNIWVVLKKESKLILCHMNIKEGCPIVSGSILIHETLTFDVFIAEVKIDAKKLPNKAACLTTKTILEDILQFMQKKEIPSSSIIDSAIALLNKLPYCEESKCLQFLMEQLCLLDKHKNARVYTNQTMIFASCLYVQSSSAYYILHQSTMLCLPHPKNLQKLISKISLDSSSLQESVSYLKTRKQFLKEHELLVTLHIDEIYIQQTIDFKGNSIYGHSQTDPTKIAKTAQVFMIASILSRYKDVVNIIPVHNLFGQQLKDMCVSVIHQLEKLGFVVLALVSDNNAVNRKTFELLSPKRIIEPCVPHPNDNNRKLFLLFDTVHILKCIRNNWISKKDGDRLLIFPDFVTGETNFTAHFKHLELMHELERNSLAKYGHLLNLKALYPSAIQKQNVNLALEVFSENNIVALKHIQKDHPNIFSDIDGTCTFLDIIVKFWKICNVKSVMEGKRFNDEYREAIRSNSTNSIQFLKDMSLWLKRWRQCVPIAKGLTAQTCQALITTIDAFLLLIPYLFENFTIDYILLSKFQNDNIEGRFGMYRQMSGSNYYISFVQVLENERKIRFKNNVLLSGNNSVALKTLLPSDQTYDQMISITPFQGILDLDFSLEIVPENILSITTYIGGFTARKVLLQQKCSICCKWLQLDKEVSVECSGAYDFVKDLDRGKLTLPTEYVVTVVSVVWFILSKIMDNYKKEFFTCGNQLTVLDKLSCILFKRLEDFPYHDICLCNQSLGKKLEHVCSISCKIFINNLVKTINDTSGNRNPNQRKIQKLT